MRNVLVCSFAVAWTSVLTAADPAGFKSLEIGAAAPDFRLPGVDDKEYTLQSFADAKLTMNRMYRKRNFQMVTISLDEPEQKDAVLKVLREKHVSSTNYVSDIASCDKFAELLDKDWPGPVPYTLLIAPGGKVIYRHRGDIEPLEVRRAIVDVLGRTYASRTK